MGDNCVQAVIDWIKLDKMFHRDNLMPHNKPWQISLFERTIYLTTCNKVGHEKYLCKDYFSRKEGNTSYQWIIQKKNIVDFVDVSNQGVDQHKEILFRWEQIANETDVLETCHL